MDIDIKDIKRKLLHEGLLEFIHINDHYLINKHISRYQNTIRFMNKNKIRLTSFALVTIYKADIVIRNEMNRVLMGIEMSVKSKLLYFLEKNKISHDDIVLKNAFDDIKNLKPTLKKERGENNKYIANKIRNLQKRWKFNSIIQTVSRLTFGDVKALITALPKNCSEFIFNNKTKKETITSLDYIVHIRNYIAHLNQIFIKNSLRIKSHIAILLNEFVIHISNVAYGDYVDKLKEFYNHYKNSVLRKSANNKEEAEDIFVILHKKLFGV